jgi:hypothetical protein
MANHDRDDSHNITVGQVEAVSPTIGDCIASAIILMRFHSGSMHMEVTLVKSVGIG